MLLSPIAGLLSLVSIARCTAVTSSNGVYNSSHTPADLPWNTYNYCNAPHVNAHHYEMPPNKNAKLVYLNVMIRHHKRTPDNLYPLESELNPPAGWDCTNLLEFLFGGIQGQKDRSAQIYHESLIPEANPFLRQLWNGTCDVGQLTAGGLEDAIGHGEDFASVYMAKLKFLQSVNSKDIYVRTSTEDRTYQVAGAMLYGMDNSIGGKPFKVFSEPSTIDSLVPSYSCPNANAIRAQYQSVPAWTDHLDQNEDLKARLDATLGTAGLDAWATWYDHFFDTFTSRTCNGHPLPCNSTGQCVSAEDADKVHAIGDFEYNYIWKAAQNASTYNAWTFGVMFAELAQNFINFKANNEPYKLRFYSGHDGSMVRLASGLGIRGSLRWPALGSEFVFEVWRVPDGSHHVRVMHEGTPAEGLDWLPIDEFIQLLQSNAPNDLFDLCNS